MYKGKLYEFEGEMLSAKVIAGKVELAPSTLYKYLKQGFSLYDAIEEGKKQSQKVFKTKPKTNNRIAKKYPYLDGLYTVEEIASMENISEEPIYRRLKKGMTVKDEVESIKKNISTKYPFRKGFYSIYKISLVTGVPKYFLESKLDTDREYTEEEIEKLVSSYNREVLMVGSITLFRYCLENQYNYNAIFHYIKKNGVTPEEAIAHYLKSEPRNRGEVIMMGDVTLAQYCLQNQYNYESIFYSIKKRGCTPEEAINIYLYEGQRNFNSYLFSLGNVLLSHFFIKERLPHRYITDRMRKGDNVEEAIAASIFLSGENYANRDIRNVLYDKYRELGYEELMKQDIQEEHKEYITSKHNRILEVMKKYHLYQAVSLLSSDLSKEDRALLLERLSLTEEDLWNCEEELFEGFEERTPCMNEANSVTYIWRGPGRTY